MDLHVSRELGGLVARVVAKLALKRLLAGVNFPMPRQSVISTERFAAVTALELLLVGVAATPMPRQVASCTELFEAVLARVRHVKI